MHARNVFADADERLTKWRIDDPPDDVERDEHHAEAIEIISVTVEIVIEIAEQRGDVDAGYAVITAGEIAEQITQLL